MEFSAGTVLENPALSQDRLERWLERWGGWLVAGLFHLALVALFSNQLVIIQKIVEPKPELSIRFQLPSSPPPEASPPPPPPPPVSEAAPAPPAMAPALSEVVATVADPKAKDSDDPSRAPSEAAKENPAPGEEAAQALAALAAPATGNPVIPPDLTSEVRREMALLRRKQALDEVSQDRVRLEVHKLETESKGRKFILDSDGGRQGAIRTLDVSSAPPQVVLRVFAKYHIRIERNVLSSDADHSFLNAAVTGDETFRNVKVNGPQDVFVLSPTAIAMMSRLETEALMKRGFNPAQTRVLEISFGIVKNEDDQWDLGVIKLKTEDIR